MEHAPLRQWHLFGHSHGSPVGRSMDVGVDTNNLFPYSFQTIKVLLEDKPIFNADYHRRASMLTAEEKRLKRLEYDRWYRSQPDKSDTESSSL